MRTSPTTGSAANALLLNARSDDVWLLSAMIGSVAAFSLAVTSYVSSAALTVFFAGFPASAVLDNTRANSPTIPSRPKKALPLIQVSF